MIFFKILNDMILFNSLAVFQTMKNIAGSECAVISFV